MTNTFGTCAVAKDAAAAQARPETARSALRPQRLNTRGAREVDCIPGCMMLYVKVNCRSVIGFLIVHTIAPAL
jgi:hypothetical protein